MKRTYILEEKTIFGHDTIRYYDKLRDAKIDLAKMKNPKLSILCMFEPTIDRSGYHQYRIIMQDGKFKKIKHKLNKY